LAQIIKPRPIVSDYFGEIFHPMRKRMSKENFEGLNPALFRKFATTCLELARRTRSPDQRALFLEMASMWQRLSQRLEENV